MNFKAAILVFTRQDSDTIRKIYFYYTKEQKKLQTIV